MDKIRVLVSHNDDEIRNSIISTINNLNYAEVIGSATNGTDTYKQIIDLQPEMVFAKYDMNDMSCLELIKKAKETLQNDLPFFNIIGENIPKDELQEAIEITNNKINALISEQEIHFENYNRTREILKDYKRYQLFKEDESSQEQTKTL